jgi:hypothetical protein
MLICCIELYEKGNHVIGALCDPANHNISFLYPFSDLSEEVIGKLTNGKIQERDTVYVGIKVRGSNLVTIVRDGLIRDIFYTPEYVYFHIVLGNFVTPDTYFLDYVTVKVGQATKDKLVMYGGKNE